MDNIRMFFLSATHGTSEKGDFYRITLNVSEQNGDNDRDFSADFFVNVDLYAKAKCLKRFQEVDAIFLPTASGRARLVSIEGL